MRFHRLLLNVLYCLAYVVGSGAVAAQTPSKGDSDLLVFVNGDKLSGHFESSRGTKATFHSDMAGDVVVDWSKVKELRSDRLFVVLPKGERHGWREMKEMPAGSVAVTDNKIQLTSPEVTETIPVDKAGEVLDERTFENEALHEVNFFRRWSGSVTFGTTAVQATQNTLLLNTAVSLVRSTPTISYLPPRNRTTANFSGSYSRITQPQAPGAPALAELKTNIFHADAERDLYVSYSKYLLALTSFDHNYSQGLDLQQIYGAGVGWTVFKQTNHMLDLKATLQYAKQRFNAAETLQQDANLVGSTFGISYSRILPLNVKIQLQAQYLGAYNQPRDYSANETSTLIFPLYKRLSFTVGTIDSYLNNPPIAIYPSPPNRRNSFQLTTGLTYTRK